MNRREMVTNVLNHKETHPIPYTVGLTAQARDRFLTHYKDKSLLDNTGTYITGIYYSGNPTEIPGKAGYFKDDYGVIWNRNGADKDIGVIEGYVIEDLENNNYKFPEIDITWFRNELQQLVSADTDQFRAANFGFTMFERCWTLMGMENVLAAMITSPKALENFFDKICDFWLPLIDISLEYDIDAVEFGDDWGQQKGLIMGPEYWRRFIKPRMAKLFERVKNKGKFVLLHSCGDCHEIFPDLIDIGLDCYQTFQPEIYNISEMKKLYGANITFWGGVSTQQCLPRMNPQQVQEEIIRIARILSPGGGYILAPTHDIPGDVKPENIMKMLEVFQNQDKYFN